MSEIHYSRGLSKFDNFPKQLIAKDFNEFEELFLADRSQVKGMTYVAAPLGAGIHYQNPEKHKGIKNWRLANYVEQRSFLAFDFDGFSSVEIYDQTMEYLEAWYRGFGYTTASYTHETPRARAILQLSRPIEREEGIALGLAIQQQMILDLGEGSIQFDESVYRGEQPIYTPVTSSYKYNFKGQIVDVDDILGKLSLRLEIKKPNSVSSLGEVFKLPEGVNDNEGRESLVLKYAGHLRGKGLDQAAIESICLDYNQLHIKPSLPNETVMDRARRYEKKIDFPDVMPMYGVSTTVVFPDNALVLTSSIADDTAISKALRVSLELDSGILSYVSTSPRREFLFGYDLFPLNTLSALAGLGGDGKTQAVIQMIVAAAIGESYANRPSKPTCSMLLGFEDSKEEMDARFSATMAHYSADQRTQAEKNIRAISLIGANFQLVELKGRLAQTTDYATLLIERMLELKALTGLDRAMLVIDHARLVAMVDWNDAAQVTALTRELHRIASEAQVAVVLIAHSPKSAGSATHVMSQADVAGSSALVDNARYVAIVKGMTEEEAKSLSISKDIRNNYIKVECVKSNYSAKGKIGWFVKVSCPNHHVATHEYVDLNKPIIARVGDTTQESKIIKYIRSHPNLTLTAFRTKAGRRTELGLSDLTVQSTVKVLLEKGILIYTPPTDGTSKKLTGNYKGVLGVANGV